MERVFSFSHVKNFRSDRFRDLPMTVVVASVVYLLGVGAYVVIYLDSITRFMVIVDIVSMALTASVLTGCVAGLFDTRKGSSLISWIVVISLSISVIFEAFYPHSHAVAKIVLLTAVCLIPCVLSRSGGRRNCPIAVSTVAMGSYLTACLVMWHDTLFQLLPVFGAIYFVITFMLRNAGMRNRFASDNTGRHGLNDNQVEQLLKLEPDQWMRFKQNKVDSEATRELVQTMGKRMEERILNEAKTLVYKEEQIISALRFRYPDLTRTELQICCHIVKGKTVSEICYIRNVSPSTVTSIRCKLRKKFGLAKNEILQCHLQSLIIDTFASPPNTGSRLWRTAGRIV